MQRQVTVEKILNFDELPAEIQTEIKTATKLIYRFVLGIADILCYNEDEKCFAGMAGGRKSKTINGINKFFLDCTSYSSITTNLNWYPGI